MSEYSPPDSPNDETFGMVYFARLCSKIRLFAEGKLRPDFHPNLGKGMDLWACQLLHIDYDNLKKKVLSGLSNEEALKWAWEKGKHPDKNEITWWNDYMRKRGFRDDLSEKLIFRKKEAGWQGRDDIQTFFDYLDADDGR